MRSILLEVVVPVIYNLDCNSRPYRFVFDKLGSRRDDRQSCEIEYPEDWKPAVEYVSDWIGEITKLYRHRIKIIVIDAQSPMGIWKQIRYRLFRFPAFIVDKKLTYIGWDYSQLEALIDQRIHA